LFAPQENTCTRLFIPLLCSRTNSRPPSTDSWYGSGEPVFSDDGKYFVARFRRDFKPTFGDQEIRECPIATCTRLSLFTLGEGPATRSRRRAISLKIAEKREKTKKRITKETTGGKSGEKTEEKPKNRRSEVDTDGIQNRIVGLDITRETIAHPGNAG